MTRSEELRPAVTAGREPSHPASHQASYQASHQASYQPSYQPSHQASAQVAAHPLLHPLALAAMTLLVINDHLLKARYPGWITGKLSDVAGLVFFPLLLAAVWELGRGPGARRTVVLAAAALTALAFALVQLWPPAGQAYCVGLGALQWPFHAVHALVHGHALPGLPRIALTPDASDLIALPAVLVPIWLAAPRMIRRASRARA